MATTQIDHLLTFEAENDLSAAQYRFVELSATEGKVDVCDAATDMPIGVLQNDPKAGQAAQVAGPGQIAKVESDGSTVNIAIGDPVGPDANGKAVKKSTSGDWFGGIALQASTSNGKVIEVLVTIGKV